MKSAIYVGGQVLPVTIDRSEQGGYSASADVRIGPATRVLSGAGDTYEAALGNLRSNILLAKSQGAAP
jgi:hypothetical protein